MIPPNGIFAPLNGVFAPPNGISNRENRIFLPPHGIRALPDGIVPWMIATAVWQKEISLSLEDNRNNS